ncbi:unnamed protein product [Closterium sp. Yama58-4]|nr:unnamed protein product [Closterium sp. Yama58-4]
MSPRSPPSISALCRPLHATEDGARESEGAGGRPVGERQRWWRARWREAAVAGARPQERWGHSAVAWDGKLIVFGGEGGMGGSAAWRGCGFDVAICCFRAPSAASVRHLLLPCAICCFRAPSAASVRHLLLPCAICCFRAPSAASVRHLLLPCAICCFRAPSAASVRHLLLPCAKRILPISVLLRPSPSLPPRPCACPQGCFGAQHFSTVLALDLATLAWAPLSAHGALPPPCDCHSASLLSGGRMLVFGGTDGRRRLACSHLLHLPSKHWQRVGGGAGGWERRAGYVQGGSVSEVGGAMEEGGVEGSQVQAGGERGQQGGGGEVESGVSCMDEAVVTARQVGREGEGRRRQVERRGSDGSHVSSSSVVRHGGEGEGGEGGEGLVWGTRQGSGGDMDVDGTPCGRGPVHPGTWHELSALAAAHPPARESHAAAVVWLPRRKGLKARGGGGAVEWRETVLVFGGSGDAEGGDGMDGSAGMEGWRGGEQRGGEGEGGSRSEGGGKGRYLNDLWALDVPSMTWRRLHAPHSLPPATHAPHGPSGGVARNPPPCARDSHSMVVLGGAREQQVAVVFGGDCGARYLSDLHVLHVHALSWHHVRALGHGV